MRKEYDFSDSKPNPYARKLKKQITIRIDEDSLAYFKEVAVELGIPYQNLINRANCKSVFNFLNITTAFCYFSCKTILS